MKYNNTGKFFVTGGFRLDTCDADTFALTFRINSGCEMVENDDDDTPVIEVVYVYHPISGALDVNYQFCTEFGCSGAFPTLETLIAALMGAGFSEYSLRKDDAFMIATLEYWHMAINEASACVEKLLPSLKQFSDAATFRANANTIEDNVRAQTRSKRHGYHHCHYCGGDD